MCDYIEVLFPERLRPDDITIIEKPDENHLGRAQLNKATIDDPYPQAPNSRPLNSWTGERLGFVADEELLELPAWDCYWLIPIASNSEPEASPGIAIITGKHR
jgi:hypothetical protein